MRILKLSVLFVIIGTIASVAQDRAVIEFNHLFDDTFTPEEVQQVRWMNEGEFYTAVRDNKIIRFNILNGNEQVLFDGTRFEGVSGETFFNIEGYQFSANERKILLKTDVEKIWRRSTREHYYVYNRETEVLKKLTQSTEKQQYAELSPQGNRAAFVRNNNLFWVDLETGEESQITRDGAINRVINGAADWVYEEEFGFAKAWFWSPEGNRIAFYRFDEERVKQFFMTDWNRLYPEQIQFKYPKAGEQNALVTIHVHHLQNGETVAMDIGGETDQYIPRINWTRDNNVLAIRRMNRLQNQQDLLFANAETGESEIILSEESDSWLDVHDNLYFLSNGEQFITTSEKDGYNHLYLYNMQGRQLEQITNGDWEVTHFVGHNERNYRLYFVSTEESPMQRHLYSIRIDGKRKYKLTEESGWHTINMNPDFQFYIDTHSDFNKAPEVSLFRSNGREIRTIEDNEALAEKLDEYRFIPKEFMTLNVNNTVLNAYMIKPARFDSTQTYPLLMYVYGGPGSQTVTRRFESGIRGMWHQYLANQGYIVVSVDNRGTGARGRDFEKQTYKKLGQLETDDQVEAAKIFARLPYVDENRLGIWGWSYGGYMASLALAEGNDVFKTAVAVAPVTDWRFYDTIYTERFMQTPQLNPEGYNGSSVLNKAGQIQGNFLLIHGTGDDNVHFQHTVEMVDALVAAGADFDTMFYPNRDHSLYGGNTRKHLYRLMSDFVLENL